MKRKCIFCDSSKSLSNEHIFPVWLLNEYGLTNEMFAGHYVNIDTFEPVNKSRTMNYNNFKNGLVCRECNNGWMSELESKAIPILKPIMSLAPDSLAILVGNQQLLSKWIYKTAYVLSYGANYRKIVPLAHGREFMMGSIPSGVSIDVGFINTLDYLVLQYHLTSKCNVVTARDKFSEYNSVSNEPYIITLKLNKLLVRVNL
ncbi:hypothetical protein [Paenibacillus marchantiophytorum]|nr:hypothetical protein [Paenibacillus marchantiophytorum]